MLLRYMERGQSRQIEAEKQMMRLASFTALIVERRLGSSRPAFIYRKGERIAKGKL